MILFPGGKRKAVTLSYDDGIEQDKRLISIMKHYGIKGTFNLNSGLMDEPHSWYFKGVQVNHMAPEGLRELYAGNEIAIHGVHHTHMEKDTPEVLRSEIRDDMAALTRIAGYEVRGAAYPYGTYNDEVIEELRASGIQYARTTVSTHRFDLPEEFLTWNPTCKHTDPRLFSLISDFRNTDKELALFYLWGHSYEFDGDKNWFVIEEACKALSGMDDVWYCTNMELCEFVKSLR